MWFTNKESKVRSVLTAIQPTDPRWQWEINSLGANTYLCVASDPNHPLQVEADDYEADGIHLTLEANERLKKESTDWPSSVFISLKTNRYYIADRDLNAELGQDEADQLTSHVELLLDRFGTKIDA